MGNLGLFFGVLLVGFLSCSQDREKGDDSGHGLGKRLSGFSIGKEDVHKSLGDTFTLLDSVSKKLKISFSPISKERYYSIKIGPSDFNCFGVEEEEILKLNEENNDIVRVVDSTLIIKTKAGDVNFNLTHYAEFADTFVYEGNICNGNYAMVHEVFYEFKNCLHLIDLKTGKIHVVWPELAFTPNKTIMLSYEEFPFYGISSEFKLYRLKDGRIVNDLGEFYSPKFGVQECRWVNEWSFYMKAVPAEMMDKDTLYYVGKIE